MYETRWRSHANHSLWECSSNNHRGSELLELTHDKAFIFHNAGSPTQHSYSYNTSGELDISIASLKLSPIFKWKTLCGDHKPVLIETQLETIKCKSKWKFWNFRKGKCNLYQQKLDKALTKAQKQKKLRSEVETV